LQYQRSSRVLLVSINNTPNATGILPGKFFEYLASGRPILAIGPKKSDIGTVLSKTNAGIIIEHDDMEGMKRAIRSMYEGTCAHQEQRPEIEQFSRRALTGELARLMESIS